MPQMAGIDKTSQRQVWLWGLVSGAIALTYGLSVWPQAFSSPLVVQDDARQQLVWLGRWLDPGLLPNDLIADYFQSVTPWGYAQCFGLGAKLGIAPLLLSKLLPPLLALFTTGACFWLSLELLPIPVTACLTTLLFNQNFWMRDDLASASPRAFLNGLFLLFLVFLVQRSRWLCAATIVALGGFYPQYVLVAAAVLLLRLVWQPSDRGLCGLGLAAAGLVLLPYAFTSSTYGPTISAAAAQALPEFGPSGRARFFAADFGRYWLTGGRSGVQLPLDPPLLGLGLLLPVLWRWRDRFLLLHQVREVRLLVELTIAAMALFGLAHLLLFRLHLPSRYTQHSLRVVMALAAAIALSALGEAVYRWARPRQGWLVLGLGALVGGGLLGYPLTLTDFPKTTYVTGTAAPLYAFLQQQPKATVVASLSEEANLIPIFGQRSTLVGSEYAIPYHVGYYNLFRQRVIDLLQAQYSPDVAKLRSVIRDYGIDFWLVDRTAFAPNYLTQNRWLQQYPQPGSSPSALANLLPRCTVLETSTLILVRASCLMSSSVSPLNGSESGSESSSESGSESALESTFQRASKNISNISLNIPANISARTLEAGS